MTQIDWFSPRAPGYSTVLADPPWPESGGGKVKRGADRHYPGPLLKASGGVA